ncbi:MAG TPA: AAA family ATPase [Candidatus Eisenbacteria bacterium]|nr:AAA family ATPase [Candidatus Eisenbacteria bacterium]
MSHDTPAAAAEGQAFPSPTVEELVTQHEVAERARIEKEKEERKRALLNSPKLVRARFKSMEARPNDYLVHRIIRPGTVTLFQGAASSLKTWAALDLLRATATGTKWLGKFPTDQVASVGIFLDSSPEDLAGQWRRLTQEQEEQFARDALIEQEMTTEGIPVPSEEDPDAEPAFPADEAYYSPFNDLVHFWWPESPHIYAPDPNDPRTPKLNAQFSRELDVILEATPNRVGVRDTKPAPEELLRLKGELAKWMDGGAFATQGKQLLVIDSLSKIHGLDENSNNEMEYVVNFFQMLARRTGIAVVLLHHWGKGNEGDGSIHSGRGASRIPDGADTIINFIRSKGEPKSKLTFPKVRGKEQPDFYICLDAEDGLDQDIDYLLSIKDKINAARKAGTPLVLDPNEHRFSRAKIVPANAGPNKVEQLLLFIGGTPDSRIDVTLGREWATDFLGLSDSEASVKKADGYYKNCRGDLTKLGLIAPTGKKGEYELTEKGHSEYTSLSFRVEVSKLTDEDQQ